MPQVSQNKHTRGAMSNEKKRAMIPQHSLSLLQIRDDTPDATPIERPQPVDVLCGRGKTCFHHEGNDGFRMLIAEHSDSYKMAPTKKAKMEVVLLVVDIVIARGGRFLVRNELRSWVDGGRKQGKKKTGHAFRDAVRGRVKCITELRENNNFVKYDDSSDASSAFDSSGEMDFENFNDSSMDPLATFPPNYRPEPSQDWERAKVDKAVADDLLNFFISEQR